MRVVVVISLLLPVQTNAAAYYSNGEYITVYNIPVDIPYHAKLSHFSFIDRRRP
jgi:hypothetical protein